MRRKIVWLVVTSLLVLALLVAACGGEEQKEEAAAPGIKVTEEKPAAEKPAAEKPAAKEEAAPAVKEAAPVAGAETVKVTLTKVDGTKMEKVVEKPKYGGVFIYSIPTSILAWDEAMQAPWTTSPWCSPTNNDLVMGDWARGAAGTNEIDWSFGEWTSLSFVTGELAESWEFADPGTIIWHIRQGVKWHNKPPVNGRELTADDVVFSLKRIYMDTPTSTMYGMAGVGRPTEIYATDKYTVVMKAPAKTIGNTWEEVGNLTKIYPPEVIEQYGDHNQWEYVTGTGPFMLTDYVPMSSAVYKRNPDYWEHDPVLGADYPLPYLDGLKLLIIPDRSTTMSALRTGKLDFPYLWWPLEEVEQIRQSRPDIKDYRMAPYICYPLGMRVDKPELPFDDIRVRRALLMGIDDPEIRDAFFKGDAEVLNYKVAPAAPYKAAGWYTPLEELPESTRELFEYHPDKAEQLLAAAGYPDGFKTEVILYNAYPYMDFAEMAKYYWDKIGVDLKLDVREFGTFMSIYQRKTHNEMLFCGRALNVRSMYLCRKGNMYNWSMIDDPKVEQYYQDINGAFFDEPRRDQLVKEMNQYVLSQAWYWAPPSPYYYRTWQPWVKNFDAQVSLGSYSGMNILQYIWYDQELKKEMGY